MKVKATNDSETHKLYMYSGHDTNVASILQGLRVFNDLAPPYASCIVIELYKKTSLEQIKEDSSEEEDDLYEDYYVKVSKNATVIS